MALDLGGIAKGYILDRALEAVRANDVGQALIIAGGDIVAGDPPPGLAGWRIEVVGVSPEMQKRAASLANAALATSGVGAQFLVIVGVRYCHVLDPRTGRPLTDRRQAFVIAPSGMVADGLATALTVADSMAARRLPDFYPGVHAEVIRHDSSSTPGSRPWRSVPSFDRYPPR
jgi:thiamine biosynthesis lipoprotein